MSSKLVRKLRREMTANPKKAGMLGLMVLVAGWFWAPLLSDWFGGGTAPPPVPVVTAETSPVNSPAASTVPQPVVTPSQKLTWQEIAARIDADLLMRPTADLANVDDPFRAPPPPEPEEKPVEKIVVKSIVTPAAAGLSLTSTMIGPRRRSARVLGKSYGIGDHIVGADKILGEVEFTVVDIEPRRIVLERDQQQFDLAIPAPNSGSGTITAVRNSAAAADHEESEEN